MQEEAHFVFILLTPCIHLPSVSLFSTGPSAMSLCFFIFFQLKQFSYIFKLLLLIQRLSALVSMRYFAGFWPCFLAMMLSNLFFLNIQVHYIQVQLSVIKNCSLSKLSRKRTLFVGQYLAVTALGCIVVVVLFQKSFVLNKNYFIHSMTI